MKTMKWLLFLGFLATALPASAVAILTTAEAKNHIGEHASVCGQAASVHTDAGTSDAPTIINLDSPYPNQVFAILISAENRPKVGNMPRIGSQMCATGEIKDDKGVPEIEVRTRAQLSP